MKNIIKRSSFQIKTYLPFHYLINLLCLAPNINSARFNFPIKKFFLLKIRNNYILQQIKKALFSRYENSIAKNKLKKINKEYNLFEFWK